jgi:hypothetical protein
VEEYHDKEGDGLRGLRTLKKRYRKREKEEPKELEKPRTVATAREGRIG